MNTTSEQRQGARKLTIVLSLGAVALVAAGVLVSLYFHPRQEELGSGEVGTYHGLGWHNGAGYTGKNWYQLRAEDGNGCWWEVDLDGYGYMATRGYYANGAVMERSVTLVEENYEPMWYPNQVRDGTYFDLDGNVVSEVKARTGRQTWFFANGGKRWELELRDGKHVEAIIYSPTGHVVNRHRCDEKQRSHGEYTSNYDDGTTKTRGRYEHGKSVGIWFRFYPDGSVKEIEDFRTDPPTETHFAQGERQLSAEERADAGIQ